MDWLAAESCRTYRRLLETEGFTTFFRQATPIDVIEESRIGSRPARRTGEATLADLRAIPWVFSWSQSRFYLCAVRGVGSALIALQEQHPDQFARLAPHLHSWAPLHYVLSNAATCAEAADIDIMRAYAGLVEDASLRSRIWEPIVAELRRTRLVLELKRERVIVYSARRDRTCPPAHPLALLLHVSVFCSSVSRNSRSRLAVALAYGVSAGMRPFAGSTTIDVRRPVGLTDVNTALYAPAASRSDPRGARLLRPMLPDRASSCLARSASVNSSLFAS